MKTQTAEEILMDYLKGDKGKGMTERYAIIAAMEFYHQQQLKILNIPVVSGSVLADLNHIIINSAMNISAIATEEPKIQQECGKIIDTIKGFTKHYR